MSERGVGVGSEVGRAPRTQSDSATQSGSFCDANCLPPEWNGSPPASGARGWIKSRLEVGSPGATNCETVWKLRRDCSSFQSAAPGDKFSRRKILLDSV